MINTARNEETNDFIKLSGTIGGLFIAVLVLVLIFDRDMIVFVLTNAVWAFVVLGIVMGTLMSKTKKKR